MLEVISMLLAAIAPQDQSQQFARNYAVSVGRNPRVGAGNSERRTDDNLAMKAKTFGSRLQGLPRRYLMKKRRGVGLSAGLLNRRAQPRVCAC